MSENSITRVAEPGRGASRRTVVKGVAWAVPAITVASAAPAVAASPGCISVELDFVCRTQDGGYFTLFFCFTNGCGDSADVDTTAIALDGVNRTFFGGDISVPAGAERCVAVQAVRNGGGANDPFNNGGPIDLTFAVDGLETTRSFSTGRVRPCS